mmetsp:Transcript_8354/g.16076  ORF Transcript_8354/g.16076 Transcript_8354/m.16076 type:complete len:178 (-) Transcript_8354:130-663(-)
MDEGSLRKCKVKFSVELPPSAVQDVKAGVLNELNQNLLKYVDDFDGVVLSYSDVNILTKEPVIHPYFPYFHLDVIATIVLFKPTKGSKMVGKVNKIGEDFIGLLILGVFNATIPKSDIGEEYKCKMDDQSWLHIKDSSKSITIGSNVCFIVTRAQDFGGYYGISGSIIGPQTGVLNF